MTFQHHHIGSALLAAAFAAAGAPASAQVLPVTVGFEAATDEVRRGLSWTEGRIAGSGDVRVEIAGFDASARVVTLRGSDRHAGAEAVGDLELGRAFDVGGFAVRPSVLGHLFTGADAGMNYVEVGLDGSYSIGPLQVGAGAVFAPSQDAIGGNNLYLFAHANAGLPMFPLSLSASIGRTTGDTDDAVRAARLRPAGDYTDWRAGVEFTQFPLTFGIDYAGTDIDRSAVSAASPFADLAHAGDRVVGRVRISF